MPPQSIIIHEHQANRARQLRPRLTGWPIRWSETRSTGSLTRAASRSPCPILVLDLDDHPIRGLEDLDAALGIASQALTLVLDPRAHAGVADLARELGATLVLSGVAVPPEIAAILLRWLSIARQRTESDGWSAPPDPEPWDRPELYDSPDHEDGR